MLEHEPVGSFGLALLYGRPPWEAVRRATTLDERSRFWIVDVSLYIAAVLLQIVATLAIALLWIAALAAYFILIVPVAYPAYAAVGFPLIAMRDGDSAPETVVIYPGVDPRKIIDDHMVSLRAFAVGLGTISALLLKASALYW